jgi:hypothetical protein
MSDKIRINGNVYSWGSITIKILGERYTGFQSITYADKRSRKKVKGGGKHQAPRGKTRGSYEAEDSKLKGPIESMQALRTALAKASPDGKSYGDIEFEIDVQFVEETSNQTPHLVQLISCHVAGFSSDNQEGEDEMTEECTISVTKILRDGLPLFDASEGSP